MDALDRCLEDPSVRERGLALLYIDLDGFKGVNDRWGHDKGDLALQCVAQRFLGVLREGDILARLGGDEFLLFLQGCRDPASPMRVAFRLVRTLSEPLEIAPERVYLGASIGIALCPDDGVSSETLLKKADEAMYRSKSAGGNCFHFAGQEESGVGDAAFRSGLPVRMQGRTALSEDPPSGGEAGNPPGTGGSPVDRVTRREGILAPQTRKGRPAPMPNPVSGPGRGCATGDNRFFPGAREPSPPSPMGRPSGRPRVFDGMTPEEAVIRPSRGGGVSFVLAPLVKGACPRGYRQKSTGRRALCCKPPEPALPGIPTSAWSLFTLRPTLPASFPDGTSPAPVSRRTRVHRHTERFP